MGILKLWLIISTIVTVQGGFTTTRPKSKWNATHTDRLRHDLLLNYDKFSRPAQHYNTTTVTFGLTVFHVDINEIKSSFTMHGFVKLTWKDEKLTWNASDYGNITTAHFADHEVWQPDIYAYNSATAQAINSFGSTNVIVYENGLVLWVPPAQFTVLCNINLQYWPCDIQTCHVIFGSWTYHGELVDLQIENNQNETRMKNEYLFDSHKWDVNSTLKREVKKYECCDEPYPSIVANITMQRISESYRAIVISPAFVVIFLLLIPFWLQPQAGEKIIIQGCTAIIICLFLLYFTQKLPAMSTNVPNIVLFYSHALYIVCSSLMNSIAVIWIARTSHNRSLPWKLKHILIGPFGKCCLGLGHYIAQTKIGNRMNTEEIHEQWDDRDHSSKDTKCSNVNQTDWILLAAAIDRVSFVFYYVLLVIMGISYTL